MCWLLNNTDRITSFSLLTSTWFMTQHRPLRMSSFNVTCAHLALTAICYGLTFTSFPKCYHLLILTMLLILSAQFLNLVYTLSAPCPPGTGVFPSAFKQAHITPLLQKPTLNTTNLENNRPISLLPFIVKILEQVVFKQVSAFSYRKISWAASILASKVDIQLFQYLSCWICLPLLTWLTTIFSCQPYWQKASQEPYSSGLSLTSQIGPSRYFGGVRCPNHNI